MARLLTSLAFITFLTLRSVEAQTHDESFSSEGLVKIPEASKQPNFVMAVHPDVPITAGQNVLWCNTLQLAWNELIDLVGGPLVCKNPPHEVLMLNRRDYTKADLDSDCYVAMAGFERNHIEDTIRAELQKKFNGQASPDLLPAPPTNPGPHDLLAYAYLYKNLPFVAKFFTHNLSFGGKKVKGFGFGFESDYMESLDRGDLHGQVNLCSYKSDNDFVIEIATVKESDQLILAKVPPSDTLSKTILSVLERIDDKYEDRYPQDDDLQVPLINFDATSHFPELDGLVLAPSGNSSKGPLNAIQNVRFQLNEGGARAKSETVLHYGSDSGPPKGRHLLFNQPFLVILKEKSAAQPYFALLIFGKIENPQTKNKSVICDLRRKSFSIRLNSLGIYDPKTNTTTYSHP